MTLSRLYSLAESEKIPIEFFPMAENCKAFSVLLEDCYCAIAMDDNKILNEFEEKMYLAHELGHCITGSFYNKYAKLDIREKHEKKANKWVIKNLVPRAQLKKAFKQGIVEPWDLAEYFDVPEKLITQAYEYYKSLEY